MRKFASAVLLAAAMSAVGTAQTKTYEVKSGDTFDAIAARFGVTHRDLVLANPIKNSHKLQIGQKLVIPAPSGGPAPQPNVTVPGKYVVRNGDHDWAIAARFKIKPSELRSLNPGVVWTNLQVGQQLNVPRSAQTGPVLAVLRAGKSAPFASTPTSKPAIVAAKWPFPTTAYRVKKGDNDWTIAHRFGIGLKKFQMLNPTLPSGKLMPGQYVRVPGTASTIAAVSKQIRSRYAVVVKDDVVVRKGAGTGTRKLTTVDRGTYVSVLDRQNEWYKLRMPRGTVGWVRGDMLQSAKAISDNRSRNLYAKTTRSDRSTRTASNYRTRGKSSPGSFAFADNGEGNGNLVSNAMAMLGARYRYGAASRGATDCSGMVIQAAKAAGIKLPRTSREMSRVGQPVAKGNLKPGDLVFFSTRGSRVSHVGIYKGNGQFVHASSSKGYVTVSNLNDGYYSRNYRGAKRVAGSSSKSKAPAKKPATDGKVAANSEGKGSAGAVAAAPEKPVEKPITRNTDEINP